MEWELMTKITCRQYKKQGNMACHTGLGAKLCPKTKNPLILFGYIFSFKNIIFIRIMLNIGGL